MMTAPEHEPVLMRREGAVLWLTLNRPHVGNALDLDMAGALMRAAISADEDDDVRCVILTGAGRMFCAGGDVGAFVAAGNNVGAHLKMITAHVHAAVIRLLRMAKPLVTAVNGPAAGAGMSLAIAGDLVLAAPAARFTAAYGSLGYTPDAGLTWLLPRLVGLRRTQELLLTSRSIAAKEAATVGLVTRVVEDADLAGEASALASTMAAGATSAIGRTRALMLSSFDDTLETHLDAEARSIAASARTDHGREGITAFLDKRRPDFSI